MEHLDCNHIQSLMDYTFPAFCPVSFRFLTQSDFKEKSMYKYM